MHGWTHDGAAGRVYLARAAVGGIAVRPAHGARTALDFVCVCARALRSHFFSFSFFPRLALLSVGPAVMAFVATHCTGHGQAPAHFMYGRGALRRGLQRVHAIASAVTLRDVTATAQLARRRVQRRRDVEPQLRNSSPTTPRCTAGSIMWRQISPSSCLSTCVLSSSSSSSSVKF